jgi:hypothetical protein
MGVVYDRHSKPLRLSAKALVSALNAIDPSIFPDQVTDATAAKSLKEVDTGNKGYADINEFFLAAGIPILSKWKCLEKVAYRNSPSIDDETTTFVFCNEIITVTDEIGEYENWLKVDVAGRGTQYLPITINGDVFFERIPQVPARVLLESCTDVNTSAATHVFLRFADVKLLSTEALMAALT